MARKKVGRPKKRKAPKRRNSSKRKTNAKKSTGAKIYDMVKHAAPYYAFASQLTQKDYSALEETDYKNSPLIDKVKIFSNIVTGRLTGFTAFKGDNLYGSETTPFTINPAGLVNKFTGAGLAAILYSKVPIKMLPEKGRVGSLGKKVLVGGAVGGLFDAPDSNPHSTSMSTPRVLGKHMSMSVIQQNRNATMQTGFASAGNDTTRSSFT